MGGIAHPLAYPIAGLSDDRARSAQDGGTTIDNLNERGTGPKSGRLRGGTREGTSRIATAVSGSSAVREIGIVQFDARGSTFAAYGDGSDVKEWAVATPLTLDSTALDIDADRNRYTTDGRSGIAKLNVDGNLVWKFVPPIKSPEHVIRALAVAADGTFYCGVSAGYPQTTARVMKFRPDSTGTSVPNLEWAIDDIGGYVERIRIRGGCLYLACNFPDRAKSTIRMYRLIDTAKPELAWERDQVPYPCNSLAVRPKDGAIFTTHESATARAKDTRAPDCGKIAVDFTPDRLTSFATRVHALFDAADIDGDGTFNAAYASGEAIEVWTDKSGFNRNLYEIGFATGQTPPTNCTAPTVNKSKTFGGQDTLQFANPGASQATAHNALCSLPGSGSIVPTTASAWFTIWVMFRTNDVTNPRAVWGQLYPSTAYRGILVNADTNNAVGARAQAGQAAFIEANGANLGPYGAYDTTTGFVVCGFSCKSDGSTASTTGTNEVNGANCTNPTWLARALSSTLACQVGKFTTSETNNTKVYDGTATLPNAVPFDGEIAAIVVVRDYNDGTKKIITAAEFDTVISYLHWSRGVTATTAQFAAANTYSPFNVTPIGPAAATDVLNGKSAYYYLTQPGQMLCKWDPNKLLARWVVNDSQAYTVSGANWTNATKTITQTGAFAGYAFASGDIIALSAGTGVTVGMYTVASKVSNDAITVTTDINGAGGNITDNSVVGVLYSGAGIGGIGFEVAVTDDRVFSHGPASVNVSDATALLRTAQSHVRRVLDNGDTASVTGSNTWESKWTAAPDYHYPKACVSGRAANNETDDGSADYFFCPVHATLSPQPCLYVYTPSGTAAGTNTNTPPSRTVAAASGARGYAAAVDALLPEYVPGQVSSLSDERVTIGTQHEGTDALTVVTARLIQETRANAVPRGTYIGACAASVFAHVTPAGVVTPPSGSPTLAGLNYVAVLPAMGRLWIADSTQYSRIDPRISDGIATVWKSKTAGALPKGGRLLAYCFQRILIGRFRDGPDEIFATAEADPYDCDISPPESSGAEAWQIPIGEPINTMLPLTDDLLVVGTPTHTWRVTGDPARGGTRDLVADMEGLAFGEPWCKDDEGRAYVFLSRGGVSVQTPTKQVSISDARIRRRLEAIDLSTYFIRLVWNWRARGLHVFLVPQGTGSGQSYGFFWEKRTDAWHYDEFPWWITSARLVDGDAVTARSVWIGCQDGKVRKFDETSDTDDGTAINWRVVMGPYAALRTVGWHKVVADDRMAVRVSRPRVTLAKGGVGATVGLLASSSDEFPANATSEYVIGDELGIAAPIQARGSQVWVRLRGQGPMEYEEGSCLVETMGIRRRIA